MRIISRALLRRFWEQTGRAEAEQPLLAWLKEVEKARWKSPADVKRLYRSADFVGEGRIVFNIGGNKFRLVVWVNYVIQLVLIKWVGTHAAYDQIDVTKIGLPARKPKKREERR